MPIIVWFCAKLITRELPRRVPEAAGSYQYLVTVTTSDRTALPNPFFTEGKDVNEDEQLRYLRFLL